MERIAAAGAGFRSLTEAIDTTTPAGRMMMQMVGAFAEFERAMIRERTSAGLAAARAAGRVGGGRRTGRRPSRPTPLRCAHAAAVRRRRFPTVAGATPTRLAISRLGSMAVFSSDSRRSTSARRAVAVACSI